MRKALIGIIIVIGGLAFTNPDMDAFQAFVRDRAADHIRQEMGEGALSDLIGGAGSEFIAENVPRVTDRRSYVVASVYAVDLDQDGTPNGRVLGIAGQFVVLQEFETDE